MRTGSERKYALFFICVLLFSALVRIPYLGCPIEPDEGGYAYQAYFWIKEGIDPYNSRFFMYLPGFPILYAIFFKIFGQSIFKIRFFLMICNIVSVYLVYLVAKKLFSDEKIAIFSSLFYAYFSWSPLVCGYMGKELFMVLPLTLSLYLYLLYSESLKDRYLILAGFFCGLAFAFKQSAIFAWFFFLFFILIDSPNKIKDSMLFLGSALFFPSILILYSINSVGMDRFFWDIFFCPAKGFSIFTGYIWYHVLRFLYSLGKSGVIFWIAAISIFKGYLDKGFALNFLLLYLIFNFFGVAVGGHWFTHYYIQLLPPLSILVGMQAKRLFESKNRPHIIVYLVLIFVPFFIYVLVATLHYHRICGSHKRDLTLKIARYINKESKRDEKIYAFLYNDPTIYFLSRRFSAFPYLYAHEVIYFPENMEKFIELIKSDKRPTYLITYSEKSSIDMAKKYCEVPKSFLGKIKACFCPNFRPFCKDYPIQIHLIREIFNGIRQAYKVEKIFDVGKNPTIVWKKR